MQNLESIVQFSVCAERARRLGVSKVDELSLILNQVDDSIALFNSRCRLIRFNQRLVDLWKLPVDWLQSQPHWGEILDYLTAQGQLIDRQASDIQRYLEHASPEPCVTRVPQTDGCSLEMRITATVGNNVLLLIKHKTERYTLQSSYVSQGSPSADARVVPWMQQKIQPQHLVEQKISSNAEPIVGVHLTQSPVQDCQVRSDVAFTPVEITTPSKFIGVERQLMEEALHWSKFCYQQIVETAMEGIWVIDANNQTTFVNQMMADMLGYSIDEMIGKSMFEFMGEAEQEIALKNVERRRQGIQEQHDFKFQRRDGSDLWTIVSTNPLFNQSGQYIGALGMLTDITERKQWEEFLQQANEHLGVQITTQSTKLQEALHRLQQEIKKRKQAEDELRVALDREKELNQLKSRFVSMVSHEFGNPLTAIHTASQLLEFTTPSESQKARYFEMIRVSVEQMRQLMEDVLLIGEAEAEKVQVQPTMLDLNQFCCHLLNDLQLSLGKTYQLQLVSRCSDPVVYLDAKLLRQILGNLLTNAIKYSPQGGTIQLKVMRQDSEVTFQVQDEGIGIPSKDLPHLFESFSRASNVGKIPGTGLGLSIVKHCVDALRGRISVASQQNEGTTFQIVLPLVLLPTSAVA